MNPIVILAVVAVVAGGIYLYTRSSSPSSPSPSPTSMPTTPSPTTPMPTTPIPTTPAPPVDCQVSEWSQWGGCSKQCGGGTQVQTRNITVQPINGGRECPPLTQSRACNEQLCIPVDCQVSDWSQWGGCSKQCGGGTQVQTRNITVQPRNGGQECPPLTQSRACNEQLCPPCKYLDWLKCDCLAKQQTRILDPSSPTDCAPGPTSQSCTPVDCDWYGFDTTYVSDGQYFARDYAPDLASCYRRCENNPNCVAVYAYNGSELPAPVECSLINKENVDVLYNNYLSTNAFRNAKNRHAFVHSKLAGDKFRPNIGTRV